MDKFSLLDQYNKELYNQTHTYEMWINRNETEQDKTAKDYFDEFFAANPEYDICYGDEDYISKEGKRINPWFKPDFSYDTFRSFNYFGNAVGIRESFAKEYDLEGLAGDELYGKLKNLIRPDTKVGHIGRILYHNESDKYQHQYNYERYPVPEDLLISIIIPSKDNYEMLSKCLGSIPGCNRQIIVVDNGSNDDNRQKISSLCEQYNAEYIYEKNSFNFSHMCNTGAAVSKGQVLLFLNDDVEMCADKSDELRVMAGHALAPHAGAVGVKLYYPGGTVIQHAGITNMSVGPAHKLGGMDDGHGEVDYYHGRNKAIYNVVAVTAAALMIEKEKFCKVGGFKEELAVAYNDVELGFNLKEHGYSNVVRNDIAWIHHESVSRGSDESSEKKARLLRERKALYNMYPQYNCYDPYYSSNLVQYRLDADYNIEYTYDHENNSLLSEVLECAPAKDNSSGLVRKLCRKGPKAVICVDVVRELENDAGVHYVEGWGSLTDKDNYLYERYLLLRSDSLSYRLSTFSKYREDTGVAVPLEQYTLLNGFTVRFSPNRIKSGNYTVGMMFTNKMTGKSIVVYSDRQISI